MKKLTGKTITLEVSSAMNVQSLKNLIMEKEGITPNQQHVIFAGKSLYDNKETLAELNIHRESIIRMVTRIPTQN